MTSTSQYCGRNGKEAATLTGEKEKATGKVRILLERRYHWYRCWRKKKGWNSLDLGE